MKKSYKIVIPVIFMGAALATSCSTKRQTYTVMDKSENKIILKNERSKNLYCTNFNLDSDKQTELFNVINVGDKLSGVKIDDEYKFNISANSAFDHNNDSKNMGYFGCYINHKPSKQIIRQEQQKIARERYMQQIDSVYQALGAKKSKTK